MTFELFISLIIMIIYAGLMVFAFFRFKKPKELAPADPAKTFRENVNN